MSHLVPSSGRVPEMPHVEGWWLGKGIGTGDHDEADLYPYYVYDFHSESLRTAISLAKIYQHKNLFIYLFILPILLQISIHY